MPKHLTKFAKKENGKQNSNLKASLFQWKLWKNVRTKVQSTHKDTARKKYQAALGRLTANSGELLSKTDAQNQMDTWRYNRCSSTHRDHSPMIETRFPSNDKKPIRETCHFFKVPHSITQNNWILIQKIFIFIIFTVKRELSDNSEAPFAGNEIFLPHLRNHVFSLRLN